VCLVDKKRTDGDREDERGRSGYREAAAAGNQCCAPQRGPGKQQQGSRKRVAGPSGASGGAQRTPAAGALQSGGDGFGDEDRDPVVALDRYRSEAWRQVVRFDSAADHGASPVRTRIVSQMSRG
jgi:hypothetical protein